MAVRIEIKRVSDGLKASFVGNDREWKFGRYMWEEGNYSCDCNRELFFGRAIGVEDPDEVACGDGRYLVRIKDIESGEEYNEY